MTTLAKVWISLVDNMMSICLWKRLKGREWKDMNLFMWNMKTCIFHDGSEGILNDVVRQLATNCMKLLKDGFLGDGIKGICNVHF